MKIEHHGTLLISHVYMYIFEKRQIGFSVMGNSVLFNGRVCTVFICQLYCHGHPAKICRIFTLDYRLFICFDHLRTLKMTILLFICRLHMVFSSPRHLVVAGGSIILLEIVYKMDFSLVGFVICCSILGFGMLKFSSILLLLPESL